MNNVPVLCTCSVHAMYMYENITMTLELYQIMALISLHLMEPKILKLLS